MFIDINRIEVEALAFDEEVHIPRFSENEPGGLTIVAARLTGRAEPGERGVELSARLEARVRLECSRCLEPYEEPLDACFSLTIVPDAVEFGVGESQVTERDAALFYAREGKAELGEIAVEQIYLNLPLKPICRVDCLGLCPACGTNRNRIQCGCRTETLDPRLAPLLEFKKRSGGG